MKKTRIVMAIAALAAATLLGVAQTKQSRAWTTKEKVQIGYSMPRALVSVSDVYASPTAKALLMQGISVGIAMGRGHATNDVPYELLLDGVKLWEESRAAYFDAVRNR